MTVKPTYEELEKRVQQLEKIESELEYFKEILQVYEKVSLGYQSLDENGHYITVNQNWLDTLGYAQEEVIGKSFADFIHPDHKHKTGIFLGSETYESRPVQVHQLVMNLATNGYHAMEENGGELMFGLKEVTLDECDTGSFDLVPGDYACLTVSDIGCGMDKALTEKIFDPFFTTKEKGT